MTPLNPNPVPREGEKMVGDPKGFFLLSSLISAYTELLLGQKFIR